MQYRQISPKIITQFYSTYSSLDDSPLSLSTRALVELRVAQINGCEYCSRIHFEKARKLGIELSKLNLLATWNTVPACFSEKEQLALHWCESVTLLKNDYSKIRLLLNKHYTDREIVDLTATIAIMNALTRIAITLRDKENSQVPVQS